MKQIIYSAIVAVSLALTGTAQATYTQGQSAYDPWMNEQDAVRPPVGYPQFCKLYPEDCPSMRAEPARVHLTPDRWQQLVDINDRVNTIVAPYTDMEIYGVEEWWDYPHDGRGDCEDYALLKRRMLMDAGWPVNSLLMTVVRDENGDGHAVLTVSTSAGDLILDNQHPDIRRWSETAYGFLMRQSMRNPHQWVSLRDGNGRPGQPLVGTQQPR